MPAPRVVTPPARRAALAAVLTLALVLAAPGVVGPASAQEGRRAVVVSDSILAGAESSLVSRLEDAGWSVTFDAAVNRTTYSAGDVLASHGGELSDTVVLSLGANDGADRETFRRRVDSVLAELREVPHVYWLTLHEVRDYYVGANEVLREVERLHPNLTVLDWHSLASADPGFTASDGLHLSPAGADAMAGLVAGAALDVADPAAAAPDPRDVAPPDPVATSVPEAAAPTAPTQSSVAPVAAPPTTVTPTEPEGSGRDEEAAAGHASSNRSSAPWWRGLAGWTAVGFGAVVALVLVALLAAGTWLGAWSMWTTRRAPAWQADRVRSGSHPAVRAQQRALRIAAAREAADAAVRDMDTKQT